MPKTFHVGVKGVVRAGDQCLVLKKNGSTDAFWDLPGGRIDDKETIPEALRRELREELPSLKQYSVGELLGVHRFDRDFIPGFGLFVAFYRVETEPFDVVVSHEHQGFRWVTLDTVGELKKTEGVMMSDAYYDAVVTALKARQSRAVSSV